MPCEIDGMSIGKRIKTEKKAFSRTAVRLTHTAATAATAMEITVAHRETSNE